MTVRTSYDAVARAGTARGGARTRTVDRIAGVLERRILEVVRRQVGEQRLQRDLRVVLVGDDQRRRPRSRARAPAAPPRRSDVMGTPVNAARPRGRSRRRTSRRSRSRGRRCRGAAQGPETAGPTSTSTIGTTPDASVSALAIRPHAWSAETPSVTSAPELAMRPTIGMPSSTARRRARVIVSPSGVPMAPRCLPPSRLNQLTVRPSISRTSATAAVLRCPKTGVDAVTRWSTSTRPRIRVALWPPNPNEFDSTGLRSIGRGVAGHHVETDVVADLLEVGGGRDHAVAQRQQADDGFGRAGARRSCGR